MRDRRGPRAADVRHAEALLRDPYAKTSDYARVVGQASNGRGSRFPGAASRVGRLGYVCLARLLDVHAGTVPGEPAENDQRRDSFVGAARQFCERYGSATGAEGSRSIESMVNEIMAIDAVQVEFRHRYALPPELDLAGATLHRTGTTAAIFRAQWQGGFQVACKAILPRYHDVSVLAEASTAYKGLYSSSTVSPRVHCSGPRFVVLDFIEGETLGERLARYTTDEGDPRLVDQRVGDSFDIAQALTSVLAKLASSGAQVARHHLDLTPGNVLLPEDRPVSELKLIDFGRNQLLVEPIAAATSATAQAARYVAPEIARGELGSDDASCSKADAYSVALLSLETFSPAERLSVNEKLNELWSWAPGLAAILEDLLTESPDRRLELVPVDQHDAPFSSLTKRLEGERMVQQQFFDRVMPQGRIRNTLRLFGRLGQIWRMYEVSGNFAALGPQYRRFRGLAIWNALAMVCWATIWITVLGLTLYHVGSAVGFDFLEDRGADLGQITNQDFATEAFPADAWGRVIAFGFGLMAFTYYTNIYATVQFETRRGPVSRWRPRAANVMARSLAFVTPAPCIIGAVAYPHWWPWATVFGVTWAAISNIAMAALHTDVRKKAAWIVGQDPDPTGSTRHLFREWWLQMAIYAGVVAMLAGLIALAGGWKSFPVNDIGAYVCGLTVLNLAFIVRLNCIKEAPKMRGFLHRTAFNLERLNAVAAETDASAAHARTS